MLMRKNSGWVKTDICGPLHTHTHTKKIHTYKKYHVLYGLFSSLELLQTSKLPSDLTMISCGSMKAKSLKRSTHPEAKKQDNDEILQNVETIDKALILNVFGISTNAIHIK